VLVAVVTGSGADVVAVVVGAAVVVGTVVVAVLAVAVLVVEDFWLVSAGSVLSTAESVGALAISTEQPKRSAATTKDEGTTKRRFERESIRMTTSPAQRVPCMHHRADIEIDVAHDERCASAGGSKLGRGDAFCPRRRSSARGSLRWSI
jgi:hypothetical protein